MSNTKNDGVILSTAYEQMSMKWLTSAAATAGLATLAWELWKGAGVASGI